MENFLLPKIQLEWFEIILLEIFVTESLPNGKFHTEQDNFLSRYHPRYKRYTTLYNHCSALFFLCCTRTSLHEQVDTHWFPYVMEHFTLRKIQDEFFDKNSAWMFSTENLRYHKAHRDQVKMFIAAINWISPRLYCTKAGLHPYSHGCAPIVYQQNILNDYNHNCTEQFSISKLQASLFDKTFGFNFWERKASDKNFPRDQFQF